MPRTRTATSARLAARRSRASRRGSTCSSCRRASSSSSIVDDQGQPAAGRPDRPVDRAPRAPPAARGRGRGVPGPFPVVLEAPVGLFRVVLAGDPTAAAEGSLAAGETSAGSGSPRARTSGFRSRSRATRRPSSASTPARRPAPASPGRGSPGVEEYPTVAALENEGRGPAGPPRGGLRRARPAGPVRPAFGCLRSDAHPRDEPGHGAGDGRREHADGRPRGDRHDPRPPTATGPGSRARPGRP